MTPGSSKGLPAICNPMGNPPSVNPQGSDDPIQVLAHLFILQPRYADQRPGKEGVGVARFDSQEALKSLMG